jgi:uncharacterized protein (DUF4415 family)
MQKKKKGSSPVSQRASGKHVAWIDPDDAPELTDDMLDRAELRVGDRIVRRGRPPLGVRPKNSVTLRLDADVLEAYRALGQGWQTRINEDLRRVRKLPKVAGKGS